MQWLSQNIVLIEVAVAFGTMLIWAVYLQLLLLGFMRQRQSVILINRGGTRDQQARCIITNMGAEPIYLVDILAEIDAGGQRYWAKVTEREELRGAQLQRPVEMTNQGPIRSGDFIDAGSFADLFQRARSRSDAPDDPGEADRLTLTVACTWGHAARVIGARRTFEVREESGRRVFCPRTVMTTQVRRGRLRRQLYRRLRGDLD